jgi:hypothetical protein
LTLDFLDLRKALSGVFSRFQRLLMVSEGYRRGWKEAEALARQIIMTSRSPGEARRRVRRLRKRLVSVLRYH